MALLALQEVRHPLAQAAQKHAALFRIAGIAGCDIQCMPYQVCRKCDAPYRHNQKQNRTCLVCGKAALEDFSFAVANGRRLTRTEVERDYYRHTHLVLGRYTGYGVRPDPPSGPPEQPFPDQVVRHLANMLRDAPKVAGAKRQIEHYYAFTLGWFSHVVSDAFFKGVYPQTVRVKFFGHQYHMAMLPAAEALTMTDISHDFGVHWPAWHKELLDRHQDGGALRHLTMGDSADTYDPAYWTPEFGKPDPATGAVMDAVQRINASWFHRMYLNPDYTSPTPALDIRRPADRAGWTFNGNDLGQVRRYAIHSGWYDTFIKGVDVYLRVVNEATRLAGIQGSGADLDWGLWRRIVNDAVARPNHPPDWGSRLQTDQNALGQIRGKEVNLKTPEPSTDYQKHIAQNLKAQLRLRSKKTAPITVIVGSDSGTLCREDALRAKYDQGLAGLITFHPQPRTLHLLGFSDFGDRQIAQALMDRLAKT